MVALKFALLLALADCALLSRRNQLTLSASTRSGIDQVIDVLKEMLNSFNTQASEDKQNWEDYSKWSDDEEKDRNTFIQEQEGVVMSSTAQLNANKQQVQTLTAQIADLTSEIAETEASLSELIHLRQEEHKAHEEEVADLTHTIEAVNKATEVLEGHYAATGASLSEIKAEVTKALSTLALSRASDPKMAVVTSLLQNPDWLNADGDAAYGSYSGVAAESGGVVGTLKSIRSTLMDQKQASIEKENQRTIDQFRKAAEVEKQKAIADTKKKQWCANCTKEAIFYCCWNTSYCDYPCQQAHWPGHMGACAQGGGAEGAEQPPSQEAPDAGVGTHPRVSLGPGGPGRGPGRPHGPGMGGMRFPMRPSLPTQMSFSRPYFM